MSAVPSSAFHLGDVGKSKAHRNETHQRQDPRFPYSDLASQYRFDGAGNRYRCRAVAANDRATRGRSPDSYPVDARGVTYTFVFFAPKNLGAGQFYFFAIKDKDGDDLEGRNTYRLRIPVDTPVKQYWSVVAYDRATHALIRDTQSSSLASNMPDLQKNADGTVDLWFGPKAPEGKESNWIPTKADGRFEALFRFYGPEQPLFDKTWVLPDIEKVN